VPSGRRDLNPRPPEPHWPFGGSQSRQFDDFPQGNRASASVSERRNTEQHTVKRVIKRVKHFCDRAVSFPRMIDLTIGHGKDPTAKQCDPDF
jgi:hypothetical protein